jgi:hypothetical protein
LFMPPRCGIFILVFQEIHVPFKTRPSYAPLCVRVAEG